MPVRVRRIRSSYRIVEADTGQIAKNAESTPVDGGGHQSQIKAMNQAQAINISLIKYGKVR